MKKSVFIILVLLLTMASQAGAKQVGTSIHNAVIKVKSDIAQENKKLARIQQKNSTNRMVLSEKLEILEQQLIPLREKRQTLKDVLWLKEAGYEQLKEQIALLKEETQFATSLLQEYRKDTEIRMSTSELVQYDKDYKKVDHYLNLEDTDQILDGLTPLMSLASRKNQAAVGGQVYQGKALDDTGFLHKGHVIQIGPIEYFVDEYKKVAGLLGVKLGSSAPAIVYSLPPNQVAPLLEGAEKKMPMDLTLGEALKVKKHKKTWLSHIQAGGVTMIPILGLGLLCLITAAWKMMSLNKMNVKVDQSIFKVVDLLNCKKADEARDEAKRIGEPVGTVLLEGIHHHKASQEHIEEIMHEQIMSQVPYLEKNLNILSVAAAAAPLLGLLGTVTGMIHTFDMVAIFGTGKVNLLSGGISEALVTTEFGLIIAIPALLIHAYLARRVKTIVHKLEQTSITFVNGLHRKTSCES